MEREREGEKEPAICQGTRQTANCCRVELKLKLLLKPKPCTMLIKKQENKIAHTHTHSLTRVYWL